MKKMIDFDNHELRKMLAKELSKEKPHLARDDVEDFFDYLANVRKDIEEADREVINEGFFWMYTTLGKIYAALEIGDSHTANEALKTLKKIMFDSDDD